MTEGRVPTFQEVINLFEEKGWTPTRGSDGCRHDALEKGYCCVIPAIVILNDPDFKPAKDQEWYDKMDSLFGTRANYLVYTGFDLDQDTHPEGLTEAEEKLSKLARDLRNHFFLGARS